MGSFLKTIMPVNVQIESNLKEKKLNVIKHLTKGWPILISYDADGNHQPCLKKGHKAHWAALLGYFSYICKWNTNKYIIEKINSIGPEITSAMAITDDGRFVGVGTLSGSVEIYVAFSLQRVYRMDNSHKIFVTGLEFLKTCPETQLLTGDNDTSLISVSIDNHIVVHSIPKLTTIGFMSSIIAFLITMLAIYFLLDFLGL